MQSVPTDSTRTHSRRIRLFDFPHDFWKAAGQHAVNDVTTVAQSEQHQVDLNLEAASISENPSCTTCSCTFATFTEQRDHFKTDWHKFNVQRKTHGRTTVTDAQFDNLSDYGSVASLSASDDESDDDDETATTTSQHNGLRTGQLAEKFEFRNPDQNGSFLVLYKVALPDRCSLESLADLGSWAVIMTGSGHFCASIWNSKGEVITHKTFHRYTSRRKQGGSQAVADSARGAANRIRSAGATLRRYGEQALEKEVHELLKSWQTHLNNAQCVFYRAGVREKRTLLVGWEGSPLANAEKEGRLRSIPLSTRRPTLKEANRVYVELSTVIESPESLVDKLSQKSKPQNPEAKRKAQPAKTIHVAPAKPTEKGTDHLKKRVEKVKTVPDHPVEQHEQEQPPQLDENVLSLLQTCISADRDKLSELLQEDNNRQIIFEVHYFSNHEKLQNVESALGLVGVAAAMGNASLVEWLMDNGISPSIGASPYMSTKSKPVRTLMRAYWGKHPDRYDYAAAGIPSPLTTADLEALAEKERQKKKKGKEKKKEKAREKAEAAKPPEQKARELRAAAAEARLLGNKCASCRKNLNGITPFERLAFKYCSTTCVTKHRTILDRQ